MISYGSQYIDDRDIESAVSTLKSGYLTQGPELEVFEKALSRYVGSEYVSGVSSGTAALHIACLSIGLGEGDYLWTSPISFVASANCALYCNAEVDFVDIDLNTGCMDPLALEIKLERTPTAKRPKAIVFVDYAGCSPNIEKIYEICQKHHVTLIEDACHAFGGEYEKSKIGSCRFSDISIFSFHPIKTITTLEGGALTTNDQELKKRFDLLRSHGISRENCEYPWEYKMIDLGYNYRMNDVSSSLGRTQLEKADRFVMRRREIANYYQVSLNSVANIVQKEFINNSACHLASFLFNFLSSLDDSHDFYQYMKVNGVAIQKHYIPIHLQPFFVKRYGEIRLPNSEAFYASQFSLPIYYGLDEEDLHKITKLVVSY